MSYGDLQTQRRPRLSRQAFVGGTAAAFATIAVLKAPAKAAEFNFKCGSNLGSDHASSIRMGHMWTRIEQESNGRIHTDFFPNSALGGDSAMLTQMRVGAMPFFLCSPGNLASVVPIADMANLGFMCKDPQEAWHIFDGPVGAFVRREILAKNIYAFRLPWHSGMYVIGENPRPIRTPEDMHGMRLRIVEGQITLDLFKTLGASPTPISANETYSALQTKIIDGATNSLASLYARKLYEVTKYISITNHSWASVWFLANNDTWKTLPPDLQAIVDRNATRYAQIERQDLLAEYSHLWPTLTAKGVTLNNVDPTPFRALLRPYYAKWSAEFGPTTWALLQKELGRTLPT